MASYSPIEYSFVKNANKHGEYYMSNKYKHLRSFRTLKIMGLIATASILSGCGAKIDLWGAKLDLPEGFDLRTGMNSVDTVDDRRGVNSTSGAYELPRARRRSLNTSGGTN